MTTGKVCKQINILQLKKNQLNWNELILIAHISTDATSKLKTGVTRKYIQLFQVVHSKIMYFLSEKSETLFHSVYSIYFSI